MAPRRISWVGECFLYSVSENIPPTENSNVLKYAISSNRRWQFGEMKRLRSQKLLPNREVYVPMEWKSCHALYVGLVWQWIAHSPGFGLPKAAACTRRPALPLQRRKLDAWGCSWFHDWLIENLLDTLHTEIFLRNSKGLAGKNLYLKVKRRKWLSFQKSPCLLLANQTKSWENRFCFYEVHEGSVKDCLTHLGISITRLRDTNSRHSLSNVCCMWESCFLLSCDISGSKHSWQMVWAIGCSLKGWISITNLIISAPCILRKNLPSYGKYAILESWVHQTRGRRARGPAGSWHLEHFYTKPAWKLPMRSCSFWRGCIVLNLPRKLTSFRNKICRNWLTPHITVPALNDK